MEAVAEFWLELMDCGIVLSDWHEWNEPREFEWTRRGLIEANRLELYFGTFRVICTSSKHKIQMHQCLTHAGTHPQNGHAINAPQKLSITQKFNSIWRCVCLCGYVYVWKYHSLIRRRGKCVSLHARTQHVNAIQSSFEYTIIHYSGHLFRFVYIIKHDSI